MTDMHYNMRPKMKEFSALARSHIPGCFALFAHPSVAVPVMQLCSPMGALGLCRAEELHWCVAVSMCALGLLTSSGHKSVFVGTCLPQGDKIIIISG